MGRLYYLSLHLIGTKENNYKIIEKNDQVKHSPINLTMCIAGSRCGAIKSDNYKKKNSSENCIRKCQ